jgi:hypothetical protein
LFSLSGELYLIACHFIAFIAHSSASLSPSQSTSFSSSFFLLCLSFTLMSTEFDRFPSSSAPQIPFQPMPVPSPSPSMIPSHQHASEAEMAQFWNNLLNAKSSQPQPQILKPVPQQQHSQRFKAYLASASEDFVPQEQKREQGEQKSQRGRRGGRRGGRGGKWVQKDNNDQEES